MSRWRVGEYELTTLLDKEAYFLKVKDPGFQVNLHLGLVEREIEEWLKKNAG